MFAGALRRRQTNASNPLEHRNYRIYGQLFRVADPLAGRPRARARALPNLFPQISIFIGHVSGGGRCLLFQSVIGLRLDQFISAK